MKIINKYYLYFFMAITVHGAAQNRLLSLEEAITITLDNNYSIKIANNDVAIAENNASKESLGYNPTINAQAGVTSDLGNNVTAFSTRESITTGYAFSYGANASVLAAYDIINPARDINLAQLKEVLEATDIQKRLTIENNVSTIIATYYEIARQEKNISLQKSTIELSSKRLTRAQVSREYGQSNRLDVLNAQVDIDRDSITLINLERTLQTTKRNLNTLMGRNITEDFDVTSQLTLEPILDIDELIESGKNYNKQILLADKNIEINQFNYDLINATKKPSLTANADYSFNYSKSAPGSFFSSTRSDGLGLGLTLRYNVYDGGLRKVQEQNTKLNIEGQHLAKEELIRNIERDITNAWHDYQNALFVIETEKSNLSTSEVNFERTEELYKAGQISSVEFRQAQLNLLSASNNYINAQYDAKQIEIQLNLLSGRIIE
jgi:outer membrane protein